MTGCRVQGWFAAIALVALVAALPRPATAQDIDSLARSTELVHSQQMPRDYRAISRLLQVELDLASQEPDHFEAAAEQIQELLDQPFDYFLMAETRAGVGIGLRARLDELMRDAPLEFRAQYERRFQAEARELLSEAVRSGEWNQLGNIIRRYAWTSSGRQAMEVQAMAFADQGEPARAARTLDILLSYPDVQKNRPDLSLAAARYWKTAGHEAASLAALGRLKKDFPETVRLGGVTVPLFAESNASLAWLDEQVGAGQRVAAPDVQTWRLPRGSETGLASAAAASPLAGGAWEAPLLDGFDIDPIFPQDPKVQENLRELLRTMDEREKKFIELNTLKRPLAPAAVPLCVGGTVIVSGPGSIKAYDAGSGKFLWTTVEVDNTFLTLNRLATQTSNSLTYRRLMDAFFTQRMWLNRTAGQMSSDGEYLYAVIDTGLMIAPRMMPFGPMVARNAPAPRSDNRLVAFELATDGTIRWSLGGRIPATQAPADADGIGAGAADLTENLPGLMGVYFLGAPLPADGVLYVLGEDRGQVKLFALDPRPKTPRGEILWSLPLLNPTPNSFLLDNAQRRMGGTTPTLENGILVCELMDGVVTAVDAARRRVLWSKRYRPAEQQIGRNVFIMQAMNAAQQGEESVVEEQLREVGWWDTNPILVGETALLTPADADELLALRLSTGEEAWPPLPRGDALYIASATAEQFVIVEPRAVEARSTATGKSLWRRPLEAPGVSGRGLRQGDRLILPIGTGDLMTFDLRTGQILAQSPMPPRVRSANLIAAGGQLILQTASRIFGYPSLSRLEKEIETQLAKDPRDAQALSSRGSLSLHQGRFAEGQADLRAALQARDNPAARRLLVWSLLADLRSDFGKAQGTLEELNRLATDPDQKFWLHLTTAEGLQRSGDETGALREYFRVPYHAGTEDLEMGLTVAKHRWVRGKIDDLRTSSKNPAALAETVASLLDEVVRSGDEAAVAAALQRLGLHAGVEKAILARKELPEQREGATLPLLQRRQDQELWWIVTRGAEDSRPAAAARLVPPRLRRGITEPVTDLLDDLGTRWGDVSVQGSRTGKQLLAAWAEDPALGGPLQVRPRWDEAKIEIDPPTEATAQPRVVPVALQGPTAGPLEGSTFVMTLHEPKLIARNRFGSDGQLDVQTGIDLNDTVFQSRYVTAIGRLVVYVSTDQFLIVDSATNQVLFKDFLVERSHLQAIGNPRGRAIMPQDLKQGIRGLLIPGLSPGGFAGNVGQPSYTSLCYQRSDELLCIDPATGELQWSRSGVPEGCEILMDEDYTVVSPPLTRELIVYRTADGRHVGRASVPRDVVRSRRGAEWGRLLLTATPEETAITYAMFDPAVAKTAWSREFPAGTEWTSADGENIAFLAPSGQFEIVDFRTGRPLFSAKLGEIPKLDGFHVRRDGKRYTVLTWLYGSQPSRPAFSNKSDPRKRELHPQGQFRHFESYERTEFSGPLFLVDGSGKILWQRAAPKYRSLLVSNTVPARWPVLAVAEEHDSSPETDRDGWSWTLEIIDLRSGAVLRSETSTDRLKGKEHFPWRTDALNRLSLTYSGKTHTIRLMGPGSGSGSENPAKGGAGKKAPREEEEKPPEQSEAIREI